MERRIMVTSEVTRENGIKDERCTRSSILSTLDESGTEAQQLSNKKRQELEHAELRIDNAINNLRSRGFNISSNGVIRAGDTMSRSCGSWLRARAATP
jgi:hypothetical protein